ncbi:MAG: hypothetical protein LC130_23130, partial [Bryobacterales bacterium]|nr:hypothetical protein [Bryobacterales bacterium]
MSELTNRMIAERAGWTVAPHRWGYAALSPDGRWQSVYGTSDYAWDDAPDYLHECNAALTLPLTHEYFWQLWGADGNWECTVVRSTFTDQRLMVMDDTAPLAICRAWLKWREMMEAE